MRVRVPVASFRVAMPPPVVYTKGCWSCAVAGAFHTKKIPKQTRNGRACEPANARMSNTNDETLRWQEKAGWVAIPGFLAALPAAVCCTP